MSVLFVLGLRMQEHSIAPHHCSGAVQGRQQRGLGMAQGPYLIQLHPQSQHRLLGFLSSCLSTHFHTHGPEPLHKEVPEEPSPCATIAMASLRVHSTLILIMLIPQTNTPVPPLCCAWSRTSQPLHSRKAVAVFTHAQKHTELGQSLARLSLLSELQLLTDCEQTSPRRRQTLHPTSS